MGTIAKVTAGGATHLVASTAYGTCGTAQGTSAKVATIQDDQEFTLVPGVTVHIKMTNSNTIANPTLNVNSTGAKSIKKYGTTAPSTSSNSSWNAGAVVSFTYDGTYWMMNDWLNTTYSSMTDAEITAGTGTTARLITPARLKQAIQTWDTDVSVTQITSTGTNIADITVDGTTTHLYAPSGGGGSNTYTLSKSGDTITLTGSGGDTSSVTDSDTTYTVSVSGDTLTLTPSTGQAQTVTLPDEDTTYTISISGDTITLTPSSGTAQTITVPVLQYTEDAPDVGSATNNVVQNDVANNVATGGYSLAEGLETEATGLRSHAEGYQSQATGTTSHAEGYGTEASGDHSHSEGGGSVASGVGAHAEGSHTEASGLNSHAQNQGTIAQRANQTVLGAYNIADTGGDDGTRRGDYVVIIGNGADELHHSNALVITWDGKVFDGNGNEFVAYTKGTDNNWTYKKYTDGTYEAWLRYNATGMALTSASSNTYYNATSGVKNVTLPSFNVGTDYYVTGQEQPSMSSSVYIYSIQTYSATQMQVSYRAHASTNNAQCNGMFHLFGKWQ